MPVVDGRPCPSQRLNEVTNSWRPCSKISSNDKFVLNIGAGISLEKDSESAINYLEARIKEIEVAIQDTSAKKHDAAAQLEQGKSQINQLIQAESQSK